MTGTSYTETFFRNQADLSATSAVKVLEILFQHLKPRSVVDFGCGVGTWLAAAKQLGISDISGIDGASAAKNLLRIEPEEFAVHDLTRPVDLGRKFDLVISLEVAEHVSPIVASTFIKTLTQHSDVVLFSAAVPYQGGTGHLNENWLSYWQAIFSNYGFKAFDILRPSLWNDHEIAWWYRQNVVVFATPNAAAANGLYQSGPVRDLIHPEFYLISQHRDKRPAINRNMIADLDYLRNPSYDGSPGYGPDIDYPTKEPMPVLSYEELKSFPKEKMHSDLADAVSAVSNDCIGTTLETDDIKRAPDFLGVGVQRAGTTWLQWLLHSHPDVGVVPQKGLHFFSRRVFAPGSAWSAPGFEERADVLIRQYTKSHNKSYPPWMRMLTNSLEFSPEGRWYDAAFEGIRNRTVMGEISPDYVLLPEREIRSIYQMNSNIKIIMILRNPVDRLASQIAQIVENAPDAEGYISDLALEPSVLYRSRYDLFIPLWLKIFPRAQLFIYKSEDILLDRDTFVTKLAAFLGIKKDLFDGKILHNLSRSTKYQPVFSNRSEIEISNQLASAHYFMNQLDFD